MGFRNCMIVVFLFLVTTFSLNVGVAVDTISSSQYIKDPESIVSAGNIFKLGFFSPANSTNRYVGIWYNVISPITPVWVANRNRPLNDSSGIMTIAEDGNLVVLNGKEEILWSSNVSSEVNNSSALLTDDGNLILRGRTTGSSLWESFQEPSHVLLPKMRLSANTRIGERTRMISWVSPSNPSFGRFSVTLDPLNIPEVFMWKDGHPYWRSGPWNGQIFIGVPDMNSVYLDGFNIARAGDGTVSVSFDYADKSLLFNYILTSGGKLAERSTYGRNQGLLYGWSAPDTDCDYYGMCGTFGICNARNSPICSCMRGFVPKSVDEWNRGIWTSGCVRRTPLQCGITGNESGVVKEDGFLKVERVKVPAFAEWSSSSLEQDCRDECMKNCSCVAYAYYSGIYCMLWTGDLIDMQQFSDGGANLYIRVGYSELDKDGDKKVIISITVVVGTIIIAICVFFSWRWIAQRRERKRKCKSPLPSIQERPIPTLLDEKMVEDKTSQARLQELPLFSLQMLATATNNFDVSKKLGEGGFGPVYKGELPYEQEIAVKRLSKASGQGLEEFMNEVMVISKLQHRNLVKLLGCCVDGEEKMLVYEYMPNKSLDAFLFDSCRRELLNWRKRFNIVEGICRGLLYLHRDSRLKIIHRDLKASNILLDQELNPKISDFGMARIFGGNEDQANTRRVVGTYGYMSPEYAMEGRFSEKSDVYSFGVLLLELVSGRRNTSFYCNEQALSLLEFAWRLWNEQNIAALVDPVIYDKCFEAEIFRCIHIGLLCVQESPKDRPATPTVISMLNVEIMDLPLLSNLPF